MSRIAHAAASVSVRLTAAGLIGTAAIIPPPARPATPVVQEPATLQAQVDRYLAPYVAERDFSGVVLIARGGVVLVKRAYGLGDHDRAVPATPDTKYDIGSITKTFTAAAVEMLAQRGQLSLHDTVAKFIPGLAFGDSVTLEQLLAHSAGVPDYYTLPEYTAHRTDAITLQDFIRFIGKKPLDFRPGTQDRYSNSGYKLLAAVVERVSGMPYATFVRSQIFDPLEMRSSGDLAAAQVPISGLAPGYDPGFPPALVQHPDAVSPTWREGNGSVYSTAQDLLRWVAAVRSERLVRQSDLPYPYGWGQHTRFGQAVLEQNGLVPEGYAAYLGNYTKPDVTIIVLGNIRCEAANQIGADLAAIVLGQPYRVPARRPILAGPDSTDGARFAGQYEVAPGFVMTVRSTPHGLLLAGPDGAFTPLDRTGPQQFFFRPLYVPITFSPDADGRISGLLWNNSQPCKRIAVERPADSVGGRNG